MLTLPADFSPDRVLAWRRGGRSSQACFAADVSTLAARMEPAPAVLNLCENRYGFMVALAAAGANRRLSLLPASRAPAVLHQLLAAHPGSYALCDEPVAGMDGLRVEWGGGIAAAAVSVPRETDAAIVAYTSGSTGGPGGHSKTWSELCAAARLSARALADRAGCGLPLNIVATVPPQHMYGLEFSVMLPLVAGCAVHEGRPLFFQDIAEALGELPAPRLLLTTPLHLRKLLASGVALPPLSLIVSATAPLPAEDARAAEQRYGTVVCEVYGCTEAGSIATRRTALNEPWSLHPGMRLTPSGSHFSLTGPQLAEPALLTDRIEILGDGHFHLLGRSADMIKVAGKRASLQELTRLLLDIPGVRDAVVFLPDSGHDEQRPAALVEAPDLAEREILAALSAVVDPVFLPRPLRQVASLPRDMLGKLPRAELMELLRNG